MKLQFKEQDFQVNAVQAAVNCFEGQPLKTNRFTLERSKELIRKAKQAASGEHWNWWEHHRTHNLAWEPRCWELLD